MSPDRKKTFSTTRRRVRRTALALAAVTAVGGGIAAYVARGPDPYTREQVTSALNSVTFNGDSKFLTGNGTGTDHTYNELKKFGRTLPDSGESRTTTVEGDVDLSGGIDTTGKTAVTLRVVQNANVKGGWSLVEEVDPDKLNLVPSHVNPVKNLRGTDHTDLLRKGYNFFFKTADQDADEANQRFTNAQSNLVTNGAPFLGEGAPYTIAKEVDRQVDNARYLLTATGKASAVEGAEILGDLIKQEKVVVFPPQNETARELFQPGDPTKFHLSQASREQVDKIKADPHVSVVYLFKQTPPAQKEAA
jgi:hypothetical protein